MRLVRMAIMILMLVSTTNVFADDAAEIRKLIPQQTGQELLKSYNRLYALSMDSDDLFYQLKCINDVIDESCRQGRILDEDSARVEKMILLYNNDVNDSLWEQLPSTLEILKNHESWKEFYDVWTLLVNQYNFSGDANTGLKEVNAMYNDAKARQNRYGMGMAYYAMGNVYSNMYNPDEAVSSYQKSVGESQGFPDI